MSFESKNERLNVTNTFGQLAWKTVLIPIGYMHVHGHSKIKAVKWK